MRMADYAAAVADFRRARQRAGLEEIMARLTGKSLDLLPYEEVRQRLRINSMIDRGLHEIPLDAIVGSVGRYRDFTRTFLPRHNSDEERWARVKVAQLNEGVPPISVYKISDAYFVRDGNHRVSVARALGNATIEAYVTEVQSRVPLTPDVQPDDLIRKAEYAAFLEQTRLDELRPDADLSLTEPGKYPLLLEHIEVHRYYMGLEQQRQIPYAEAVAHWYDAVYLPVARLIRELGMLRDFPDRTEADLYLWLAEHRAEIEEGLGWKVPTATAASDLAAQFGSYSPHTIVGRALQVVVPGRVEPSAPGQWRRERLVSQNVSQLFNTLLVPISMRNLGWQALDQALAWAQREGSQIRGLLAVAEAVEEQTIATLALQREFKQRCEAAGITGELIVEVGQIDQIIYERARWVDLIVLHLSPHEPEPRTRLKAAARQIIQRSPGPVLVIPGELSLLNRPLLLYDETAKSDEALFAATYLSQRWQVPLNVVVVCARAEDTAETLAKAQAYLDEQGVPATFITRKGAMAAAVLETAATHGNDLIIMGAYSANVVFGARLGSDWLDQILQASAVPVLICP